MKNATLVFPARYPHALNAALMRWRMRCKTKKKGKTAFEMARNEDTVKCFLDAGIKLSDIVTDQVVIACVCASDWGEE